MIGIAFVAGAIGAYAAWFALRATFAAEVFTRRNYRGVAVPTAAGLLVAVVAVAFEGVFALVRAFGIDVDPATSAPRALTLVVVLGFGLLGLVDDVAGAGDSGGFRGHVRALGRGRLTTGGLKLLGGAALALAVVAAAEGDPSVARLLADAALVALAANLGNLFDRAPGRVGKFALVAFAVLAIATRAGAALTGAALVAGAALGLLMPDLREDFMLGDAGANPIGAALGLGVVLACSPGIRLAVLVVVLALNIASEFVSFGRVIDGVAPLRAVDRLGRRR